MTGEGLTDSHAERNQWHGAESAQTNSPEATVAAELGVTRHYSA